MIAHLVSVCRGVVDGTERHLWEIPVDGPGRELPALLEAWAALDAGVEGRLTEPFRRQHAILIMDCLSHELDLRSALGLPVLDDHPAYPVALDLVTLGFGAAVGARGLPALRVQTPGAEWLAGQGEPVATVRGHRHDLYRSLTGRRTVEQIYALDWTGDPGTWLPAFAWGPFQPPDFATEVACGRLGPGSHRSGGPGAAPLRQRAPSGCGSRAARGRAVGRWRPAGR